MNENGFHIVGADYFAPKVETVQLPSMRGTQDAVQLQRPDLIGLIRGDGDLPDVLSQIVTAQINGKQTANLELDANTLPQLMKSLDIVAIAAFVAPMLHEGDEPVGDAIPVGWIGFEDKAFVFSWALGAEYVPASRFPQEPGGDVEPVSKVSKVRSKSK